MEEESSGDSEESSESVDVHGASDVADLEDLREDGLVQAIEASFEGGDGPHLVERNLADESAHGNEDGSSAEVSSDEDIDGQVNLLPFMAFIVVESHDVSPEAFIEHNDLNSPACNQEVEANGSP